MSKIIRLTETVLRDGQQSQIATRMSIRRYVTNLGNTGPRWLPC